MLCQFRVEGLVLYASDQSLWFLIFRCGLCLPLKLKFVVTVSVEKRGVLATLTFLGSFSIPFQHVLRDWKELQKYCLNTNCARMPFHATEMHPKRVKLVH
jgi:hypothetical protein